jgi:hypothetical protein
MSVLIHLAANASFLADASGAITTGATAACGNSCGNKDIAVIFKEIADALIFLVGAVSVIMIIVGGLRYVISNGDSKQISAAKDTILYSVIGIVVAIAAFAIVNFVAKIK